MTPPIVTIPETHRDLVVDPGTAALTTVGSDGYPQTTAIWYVLEGDVVRTSLNKTRQKYRNLVRHPHATLFRIDPESPFRTLEIRADVTITEDEGLEFLVPFLAGYGLTLETFPAPIDQRVVVTLTPHHVVTNG